MKMTELIVKEIATEASKICDGNCSFCALGCLCLLSDRLEMIAAKEAEKAQS